MSDISKEFIEGYLIGQSSGAGGGGTLGNVSGFTGGVSGNSGVVNLSWNAGGSGAENVLIKRQRGTGFTDVIGGGSVVYTGAATDSSYNDTLPDLYHSYCYRTITKKGNLYNATDNSIVIPAVVRGKYIYNAEDECPALTGYWYGGNPALPANVTAVYGQWNNSHVLLSCADDTAATFKLSYYKTANRVDFSGFTKICAEIEFTKIKRHVPEEDNNYLQMMARSMPFYSYNDINATADEYPYVLATYRNIYSNGNGGYWVFFSEKPFYFSVRNGVSKILTNGNYRRCLYKGDGTGLYYAYDVTGESTELDIMTPSAAPNVSQGDYMGGAYTSNSVYAVAGQLKVVSGARFWMTTKKMNNYDYTEKVSSAAVTQENAELGVQVIEMPICDIDNSVSPPTSSNYVTFGAFESNVKIYSIWLQE